MKMWYVFVGCLFLALLPALLLAAIALDHNPQEEYQIYETGALTTDFFVLVGVWWLLFASPVLLAGLIYRISDRSNGR